MSARHVAWVLAIPLAIACKDTPKEASPPPERAPTEQPMPPIAEDMVRFPEGDAVGRHLTCGLPEPHDYSEYPAEDAPYHVEAFAIDRRPVTCAQYDACVAAGGCGKRTVAESCSNDRATARWPKADAYCRWRRARLPTYFEWQRAVRGKEGRILPPIKPGARPQDCEHPTEKDPQYPGCEYVTDEGVVYYTLAQAWNEWTGSIACDTKGRSDHASVELDVKLNLVTWVGNIGQFRCARSAN